MSGKFICIEGPDGCGKTTQSKLLAEALKAVRITAPSDGETGRLIRRVLRGEAQHPGADALQLLFCADRSEQEKSIRAVLKTGRHVVADRWSMSGLCYGAVDAGAFWQVGTDGPKRPIESWRRWFMDCCWPTIEPDHYLVLKATIDDLLVRLERRQRRDLYENRETLERVCANYYDDDLQDRLLDSCIQYVGAIGTVEETAEQIMLALADKDIVP